MYEHSNHNIELTVCLSMCQRAAGPIGLSIFKDIACVVVNDGAYEVDGGVRGRGDCFQEDALSCNRISAMKRRWMSAK